ncbi:hypothetical protein LZ31DRAFT_69948 [Colletotrichum somersetense]|nr:hypothetical protein LZ31DRAFT_69948 [Colletotrichum somersetense]
MSYALCSVAGVTLDRKTGGADQVRSTLLEVRQDTGDEVTGFLEGGKGGQEAAVWTRPVSGWTKERQVCSEPYYVGYVLCTYCRR